MKISINYSNLKHSKGDELQFNSSNAYKHIVSQLDFGFRVPGFAAHEQCADWIRSQMQNKTDQTLTQNFSVHDINCQNVLGKLNTDKQEIVIFGAHWDSRAIAEKDPVVENKTTPIPGANDGGSGVAVLIEFARILYDIKEDLNVQIWFLFIDAEDQGSGGMTDWSWCEGSKAFTAEIEDYYSTKNDTVDCFILLDMVGGTNLIFIDETKSTNSLQESIFTEGRNLGYSSAFPTNPKLMGITDDHVPFLNLGISSVDLIIDFVSGPWIHHHKHSDNLANIDINSLEITGRTVESWVKNHYTNTVLPSWEDGSESWTTRLIQVLAFFAVLSICLLFIVILRRGIKEKSVNR
ncbi:MAG: M28 family peptidase [Promethearchaeota archaeon]